MASEQNVWVEAIARALKLPIQDFYDGLGEGEAHDTAELLRLWSAISDRQGRMRVLNLTRREAERAGHVALRPKATDEGR